MAGPYSLAMELAVAALLWPYHRLRCIRSPGHRDALEQWLGRGETAAPPGTLVVVHAVSAGEMVAAGALIRQLSPLLPALRLLLTTSTDAGIALGQGLQRELPAVVGVQRLPWDRARALRGWLRALAPRALLVIETELWPNLFAVCRQLGIPLAVASGRLYPGDVWRYRLIRPFMTRVLDCAHWIWVQNTDERQRFLRIGADPARLRVMGNAKAMTVPSTRPVPGLVDGPDRLIVAGSTHAPEERWLLQALAKLRGTHPDVRLVLAPRRVQRARALAAIAGADWRCRLASDAMAGQADWDVLILDRFGQLPDYYAAADVVVIGGSLARHGGHNFLEPAFAAKPLLTGPHLAHFEDLARQFLGQDAMHRLQAPSELAGALTDLLTAPEQAQAMGRRARDCAEEQRRCALGYAPALAAWLTECAR